MRERARLWLGLLTLIPLLVGGCGRFSTEYGISRGTTGRSSLNGFGFLRDAYQQAGFRTRDISRLSDRVARSEVIVWTPQVNKPIAANVTRWFERWMRLGDRTLIYIVPDSGSETDYWQAAAQLAPPEQRLEYRRRAAESINRRVAWRLNRRSLSSNGWFKVEPLEFQKPIEEATGPWQADNAVIFPNVGEESPQAPYGSIEFELSEFEAAKGSQAANQNNVTWSGQTGPSTPQWNFVDSQSATPTATKVDFQPLLKSGSGQPIVAEMTSPSWKESQILVVAGGSLLTNFALTQPANRRLAAKLIQESQSTASADSRDESLQAGFLTTDWSPLAVSEKQPGVPAPTGMEILTTWPLSLVTMHGLFLGVVLCLMLLPIFGRPRRVRYSENSDFGHHLDAVAALMNKAGGEAFARQRISEYFKHVHGETSGPWIIGDHVSNQSPEPGPMADGLTPQRMTIRRRSDPAAPPSDSTTYPT